MADFTSLTDRAHKSNGRLFRRIVTFFVLSVTVAAGLGRFTAFTQASPSLNRMLNYQIRLTDAAGVPVADGTKNLKLTVYTASSGGTQLYTACSADGSPTGTPTAVAVTFANGTGTTLIGSTGVTCASGTAVAIPADLFNADQAWLGVTVEADAEMTPRKRIVASAYSLNADRIDDLETSAAGGTVAFVPVTDASGLLTLTGDPTTTAAVITANPTAAANELLIDLKNASTSAFTVDGEGDVIASGNLTVNGDVTLGNATADSVIFTARVASDVLPQSNDTYDLGTDGLRWRDLYLGPATLHIGSAVGDEGALTYNTTTNALAIDSTGAVEINGGSGSSGCSIDASGNFACSGTVTGGGGAAFQNGGNSFSAAAILGTNDANSLSLETNNVTYLTIASGGGFTLPVDTDWTLTGGVNGLSFDGTTFSVDALNNRIGIGDSTPDFILDIEGSAAAANVIGLTNTSSTGYSAIEINNSAGSAVGNIGYGNASAASFPDQMFFASNGKAIIFSRGANEFQITAGGIVNVNRDGDPAVDFQVEGDTNQNLLFADASVDRIGIGDASPENLFSVDGTAFIDGSTIHGGTGSAILTVDGNSGTDIVEFRDFSANSLFVIESDGKVGISDNTPTALFTVGSGDKFKVNADGDVTSSFTQLDGTDLANGAGSATTTLVLDDTTGFDAGNYVLVNSTYAKIVTVDSATNLTISPALTWADNATVDEYHVPEIGGVNLTQTLTNRYGRGYFIDGIVAGNGSTYITDNKIESGGTLVINGGSNQPITFGTGTVTIPGTLSVTSTGNSTLNGPLRLANIADPDPTGSNGLMYYNTTNNKFRCFQGGAWTDCIGAGGGMSIGGTVTSGTAGSLLFVGTGPVLAQDNANLFWDDASDRLGLGDATPAATLTVGSGDLFQVAGASGTITTSGDLALNGGDVTSSAGTFNFINTTAATALNIGAAMTTGTITIGGTGAQTGAVSIAPGTDAGSINIGNSTGFGTITIGGTGNRTVDIRAGSSGNIFIGQGLNANQLFLGPNGSSTATVTLSASTGTNTVNVGTGTGATTLNLATGTTNGKAINIGTGAVANTIAVGNSTGATSIALNTGTGSSLNLGTNAVAHTVTIGNTTGGSSVVINAGTGNIDIGTSANARTVNIANGAALQVVTLGSTSSGSQLTLNTGGAGTLNLVNGTGGITMVTGATSTTNGISYGANGVQTGNAFNVTSSGLTSGAALFINSTNTLSSVTPASGNTFSGTFVQSSIANTAGYNVGSFNLTSNSSIAGNTENILRLQNQATSNTTDVAVSAGLLIDNADTSTSGSTVITDAIKFTASGGLATPFTNYVNAPNWTVTNAGLQTLADDLAVNGGDLTSTAATFNLLNANVTTLNVGDAVGGGGINLAGGFASTGCTVSGSSGNWTCSGDASYTGGDVITTSLTASLFNTSATTLSIGGSATTLNIGASTGTATISNATVTLANATTLNVNGASPSISTTSTGTASIFNTNAATVNVGGAATTLNLAGGSGSTGCTIDGSGNFACSGSVGSGGTLQAAYNGSTTPELTLDSTRGGLTIRDASSPIGTNLLEIQNNAGGTTYLGVTTSALNLGVDLLPSTAPTTGSASRTTTIIAAGQGPSGAGNDVAVASDTFPVIAYYDQSAGDLKVAKCSSTTCSSGTTFTTVDSTGNVGSNPHITLGSDGFPVISYYDSTNQDLKVLKCGNASCSSGNTITTVDSTDDVGQYNSIAVPASGTPVISYLDGTNTSLEVVKCGNASCSSGNTITTVDNTGDMGYHSSIANGSDGFPVISHIDGTNWELRFAKCSNASCSTFTNSTLTGGFSEDPGPTAIAVPPDGNPVITHGKQEEFGSQWLELFRCGNASCSSGNTSVLIGSGDGETSSVAISSDNLPFVSYYDGDSGGSLETVKCGNAGCSSGNTNTVLATYADLYGEHLDAFLPEDGLPIISHYDEANGNLVFTKCGNATCTSGNSTVTLDSTGVVGTYTSIVADSDSLPVISYYDSTNLDLKVVKCGNTTCSSGNTITTLDSTGSVGSFSSIAIDASDLPVISYYDATNQDLKVLKCGNLTCSTGNTITTAHSTLLTGQHTSIAVDSDGIPTISYYYATGLDLYVYRCANVSCTSGNAVSVDTTGTVGAGTSITIPEDDLPVISYYDGTNTNLKVVKCGNTSCSSANSVTTVDSSTQDVGALSSISVRTGGTPIISYQNTSSSDIKVAKCENVSCTSVTISTVDATGVDDYNAVILGSAGLPLVFFHDNATTGVPGLKLVTCIDSACELSVATSYSGGKSIGSTANYFTNVYASTFWGKNYRIENFDLAETYRVRDTAITAGDIVRVAPAMSGDPAVEKTTRAYDAAMGVISTQPGLLLTQWDAADDVRPVALKGRVPVKVNNEGGAIRAGDAIAPSSEPGVGMRASKPGRIVGYALDDWEGTSGTVELFVNPGFHDGDAIVADDAGLAIRADVAMTPAAEASEETAAHSLSLSFRGSAWDADSGLAVTRAISARNAVTDKDAYRLSFANDAGDEIAFLGQDGDVAIKGRLFPSDRGALQTEKYIYYDGSTGPGGNRMRTNANGWGADGQGFAEMFPSDDVLEEGEIAMIDTRNPSKMRRAIGGREDAPAYLLAGIVTAESGYLSGMEEAGSYPIALEGRAKARVVGPVKIGDAITISLTNGVGVVATTPTYVVGYALEAKEDAGPGAVLVFVKTGWWNGSGIESGNGATSGADAGGLTVTENTIDFSGRVLLQVGAMEGYGGEWRIDAGGFLVAKEVSADKVVAKQLAVRKTDAMQTVGNGTVVAGSFAAVVSNAAVTERSQIIVTFRTDPGNRWWIDEVHDGSFILKLAAPAVTDVTFTYLIVDVIDETTPAEAAPPVAEEELIVVTEPSVEPPAVPEVVPAEFPTPEEGTPPASEPPVESAEPPTETEPPVSVEPSSTESGSETTETP